MANKIVKVDSFFGKHFLFANCWKRIIYHFSGSEIQNIFKMKFLTVFSGNYFENGILYAVFLIGWNLIFFENFANNEIRQKIWNTGKKTLL